MPRAVDRRNIEADYDPTRQGTEFHFASMLGDSFELVLQALQEAAENLKAQVIDFIKDLTGLDLSSPESLFVSLAELVVNGPAQVLAFIESIIRQIGAAFLNGGAAVEQLIRNFPPLPFSHIVDDNPLSNSTFDTNLDGWTIFGGGWSHDASVGKAKSGSAKATGDGTFNRDLISEQFDVEEGQEIPISASVRWAGFTSTAADAIQLAVTLFDGAGNPVGYPVIDAVGPTGTQTAWQTLSGTLTVPEGAEKYAVRLSIRSSGTGQAWFDDIHPSMPGSGNALLDILEQLPVIGDIVRAITGIANGTFFDLEEWAQRVPLLNLITGWLNGGVIPNLDASKITDGTFLQSLIPRLDMDKINGLVEAITSLPIISDIVALINRFLRPAGLPLIPLSSIADIQPNLLFEGGFDAAETVNTADGWTWDGTIGRGTPVGSAKVVATGTLKELQSGPDTILVEEAQELSLSAWVRWRNLTTNGSGAPVQLTVRTYDAAGATVSTHTIAGLANSHGDNSSNASQNDFVQLTGSWTVPAGVSSVRLRLAVLPSATAGQIWFDDAEVTKTQKMPQTFISGLTDALENLFGWIEDLVNNLLGALGLTGSGTLLDRIFDLADEIGDWLLGTEDTAGALDDLAYALLHTPEMVMGQLQAVSDIVSGIFNGWFGSGSTGDPAEVQYVIEAIKDTVTAGYNVTTFTSSGSWNKPAGVSEIIVILIASGANGASGSTAKNSAGITVQGGSGGQDGSYVVQQLEPADVPNSVPITVGINGGNTSFGSLVTVSPGAAGGMATQFGFSETTSLPGAGGKGGNVVTASSAATGNTGGSSAVAGGGSGGTGRNASGNGSGNAGDAGDNANPAAVTKCGGGGGGGGGGCYSAGTFVNATGGNGGPGGYPGGGGGGGGAAATAEAGNVAAGGTPGPGAAGILWIYWR
jgi:hypothetical protein